MTIGAFFFKKYLQRLEKEGNNDPGLIIEFGADAYSTKELNTILQGIFVQQQIAVRWKKHLSMLGLGISMSMLASLLMGIMDAPLLSYIFLSFVPLFLLFGLVGHLIIQNRYPNLGDSDLIASIIQQELEWRKKDKLLF